MRYTFKYIFLLFLLQISFEATAQQKKQKLPKQRPVVTEEKTPQDTSKQDRTIFVDVADIVIGIEGVGRELIKENRQVELRQNETYMYCDKAFLFDNNDVKAWGNVIIQQGDSVNIFADSLIYNGNERKATLFGEVVLESQTQKLFTNKLNYDLNTKVATYFEGATLTNDTTQLTSKRGYYYVNTDEVFFKDSVEIVDPEFELKTDTLKFNTKNKIAYFLGPTLIAQNDGKIYCEDGYYDTRNKNAEFTKNAQYQKGEQKAWAEVMQYDGSKKETTLLGNARYIEGEKQASADVIRYEEEREITNMEGNAYYKDAEQEIRSEKIRYDQKSEIYSTKGRSRVSDPPQILEADDIDFDGKIGIALGNVIWQDTAENIMISHCDSARYVKEEDYFKAMKGRPLMTTLLDGDTLFLSSDTLVSFKETAEDSLRSVLAYRDVKVFKSDLQAVCDSLIYSEKDSIFRFFKNPIIWSDTTQFSADTIHVQMANKKIDKINMYQKSFMINSPDEQFFNQIKGKFITAFFKNDEVDQMKVIGNAESLYYALDEEEAYLGANQAVCSEMLIHFGNNKVEDILFYNQPTAKFIPMQLADHNALRLEGFRWQTSRRPRLLSDLILEKK